MYSFLMETGAVVGHVGVAVCCEFCRNSKFMGGIGSASELVDVCLGSTYSIQLVWCAGGSLEVLFVMGSRNGSHSANNV